MSKRRIINYIGFFIVISLVTYMYLFGKITYTADNCVSGYDTDGTSITAKPGDESDLIICNYTHYLPAGLYYVIIDGYNEYKEYNYYEIFSDELGGILARDVFVSGKKIPLELEHAVKDFDVRVYYQDAGTVTVEKVTIERINTKKRYFIAFFFGVISSTLFILFDINRDNLLVKILKIIFGIVVFCLSILTQFVYIEALYDSDSFYHEICVWLLTGARESYLVWISCTLLAFIDVLVLLICKYYSIAIPVSTLLTGVYALVGYNYYISRGDVFTFSQLRLAVDAARVVNEYTVVIPRLFWVGIVVSLLFSMIYLGDYVVKKWAHRLVYGIISFAAVIVAISNVKPSIARNGGLTVLVIADYFYEHYGYLVGTVVMLPEPVHRPDGYNEERISSIIANYESEENLVKVKTPNIIYVQCETLFDMTQVTSQRWSENPLAYMDTLAEEYYVGNLISPMAGGGTCNVEYEMLTGYTYYNRGGTPFVTGLRNESPSFVSDLEKYGYNTVAIHTNTGAFFDRETAYSSLGFDEMLFTEQLGETPVEYMHDRWANDYYAYKSLIDNFESRDKSKPYFAYIVTTQNHGDYSTDYDEYGITVYEDISMDANRQLQTYLNLEKESMEALKYLLDYFSTVDDDVIIVYWGDHCPGMNLFNIGGETVDYVVNSHKTPLLVWNNYGESFDFGDAITSYQFTPKFMQQLGMRNDSFMNYSAENNVPTIVVGNTVLNEDGTYAGLEQLTSEENEIKNNMWLLQYDREFGKRYSYSN